jgi:hypothetical protein
MQAMLQDTAPAERDLDPGIAVPAPGLQQQNADLRAFGQTMGKAATGRAGTDDNIIVLPIH